MLSIDVGFGNVKSYDGESIGAFPSVYMKAPDSYVPLTDPDEQLLELDGEKYHVGFTALKIGGLSPFNREDMLRHKIFMLTAICEMIDGKEFSDKIALGLPISDYSVMKKHLEQLKGEYDVVYNGRKVHINIKGISVYAQSEAVYELVTKDDTKAKEKIIGIVDIGQKTVDFAYFNEGRYVEDRSGSIEQGVINAYQSIAKAVNEKLGFEIKPFRAKKYIEKVPDDSTAAFEKVASLVKDELFMRHWNFNEMDSLYIVGGGTSYIAPYFKDAPYKPLDEQTAVFANAYGYYAGEKK